MYRNNMKKTSVIVIVLAVVALLALWFVRVNNRLVSYEENTSKAWAQVENVYKRRMDLIPQLVSTVQGAANYERATLQGVIDARSHASQTTVDPSTLSEESIKAYQAAQDQLTSALSRAINITVERYPELTATQGFRDLQTQLEGTENRITPRPWNSRSSKHSARRPNLSPGRSRNPRAPWPSWMSSAPWPTAPP